MDSLGLLKKILPGWTLFNIIITIVSMISAIILYITKTILPNSASLLEFTLITLVNMVFIIYWTFWFVLTIPPIVGALYLSRTEPDYYRYAVQNIAAVIVLYLMKLIFNFDILTMIT